MNRAHAGNNLFNYVSTRLGNEGPSVEPYSVAVVSGGVQFSSPDPLPYAGPLTRLVVLRRNEIQNNGGIFIGGSSSDVLVEHNTVANSTCLPRLNASQAAGGCIAVDATHAANVLLRGNVGS